MAISFAKINDAVLNRFGLTVTTSSGSFSAILDTSYMETFDGQGYDKSITAKTSDVSSVSIDDEVTINGLLYYVRTKEDDEEGMTKIMLELV